MTVAGGGVCRMRRVECSDARRYSTKGQRTCTGTGGSGAGPLLPPLPLLLAAGTTGTCGSRCCWRRELWRCCAATRSCSLRLASVAASASCGELDAAGAGSCRDAARAPGARPPGCPARGDTARDTTPPPLGDSIRTASGGLNVSSNCAGVGMAGETQEEGKGGEGRPPHLRVRSRVEPGLRLSEAPDGACPPPACEADDARRGCRREDALRGREHRRLCAQGRVEVRGTFARPRRRDAVRAPRVGAREDGAREEARHGVAHGAGALARALRRGAQAGTRRRCGCVVGGGGRRPRGGGHVGLRRR